MATGGERGGQLVDVFISYSRVDHARVAMLARAVEAEGYAVWWDADLPPHQSYGDVITAKIGAARAAIVVWSADAVKSEWVRAEADMARNQKKLVQTAIGDLMPPLPFNQIQYVDIGAWNGEPDHPGWRKVKASLAELCAKGEEQREWRLPASPPPEPVRAAAAAVASRPSRWPLLAGGGVAVVALAALGGVLIGQGKDNPGSPAPAPTGGASNSAPIAAPTVYVTEKVREVAVPEPKTSAPSAAAPAAGAPRLYFPDSSVRMLDASEFAGLTKAQLRIARNEIFAREGRAFQDPALRDYFAQFSWYRPRGLLVRLNPIEQRNVVILEEAEGSAP